MALSTENLSTLSLETNNMTQGDLSTFGNVSWHTNVWISGDRSTFGESVTTKHLQENLSTVVYSSTSKDTVTSLWLTSTFFNISTTVAPTNLTSICGIISNTTSSYADYSYLLPSFVFVCLLLLVGFPGNALVIYVYLFKWPKSTSRVFILALAIYDIINCSTSMPHEIALLINYANFDYPVLCKISRFITGFINNTTTFLLIVIAVDRFKRICRPHNKHINPRQAKKLVFCATIFGIGTNWPMLILYGTMTIPNGKTCLIEDKMLSTEFPMIFILFLLLGHFVTDCILVTLYSLVGKAIYKRRHILKSTSAKIPKQEISQSSYTVDELDSEDQEQKRNRLASFVFWNRVSEEVRNRSNTVGNVSEKKRLNEKKSVSLFRRALSRISDRGKENNARVGKTTVMLFLVTVVFIVSFIPHVAMVIWRYTGPKSVLCLTYVGKRVYEMALRSYLLNSVLNPIVYCFVSKQFRTKCKAALLQICCCSGPVTNSSSVSAEHSKN